MAESRMFQLADAAEGVQAGDSSFVRYGYRENPFPATGLSGQLYTAHMPDELRIINRWLFDVQQATLSDKDGKQSVAPLALRGALGVGKTHLLRTIESGLQQHASCPVLRRELSDEGTTRLLLSSLLLAALPNLRQTAGLLIPIAAPSSVPLLDEIVENTRNKSLARRRELLTILAVDSQLKAPLQRILEADASHEADLRRWFALWLTRGATTPTQRGKLGLSSPLEGEGQAIRVVADLMRLARKSGLLQVWFVLIDQLEELWRPHVVTEGRAARFLTDVRALIDDALEGAPIAVLLAWNTATSAPATAEDPLAERYRALWQRLNIRVDLPGLREEDIWPFAAHYLRNVASTKGISGHEAQQKNFEELLQHKGLAEVRAKLASDPQNAQLGLSRYAQRIVLQAWRSVAIKLVDQSTSY